MPSMRCGGVPVTAMISPTETLPDTSSEAQLAAVSFSSLPSTRSTSGIAANVCASVCAAQPVTTIFAFGRSRRRRRIVCRACFTASPVTAQVLTTTASVTPPAAAFWRITSDS